MISAPRWLLPACGVLLAACADATTVRVVARVPVSGGAAALRDAIAAHTPAVVVALDADGVDAAREAAPAARLVAIGSRLADAAARAALETIVVEETGAVAAIELALLAANGIALPPRVALGTRVLTAASAAAGGAARPGPGDVGMAMLRQQHAAVLTTSPAIDVVFTVGFVAAGARGAWHDRVRGELEANGKRYPQLALRCEPPVADAEALAATVRRCADAGARVLLLAADDPRLAAAAAAAAAAAPQPVAWIAIDRAAEMVQAPCVVGPDPRLLARAAADAVRSLLGDAGGAVVVVHGDLAQASAALRLEAFEQAVAPPPAK